MKDIIAIVISILSFLLALISLVRTIRRQAEASWAFIRVDADKLEQDKLMPPLKTLSGNKAMRVMFAMNDGDGDAFDVRAFGHNCIVHMMKWEELPDGGQWKNEEITMWPMVKTGDTVNLIVRPLDGDDEIPDDAEVCVHWTKTPTRLRKCGYEHIPVSGDEDWWDDKDWQVHHRIAERWKLWLAHRRFHRHPQDAMTTPTSPFV